MKNKVKVGKKWVGNGEPAFVIAEIGSNHNRKMEQAKDHIDAAIEAGADAVKFQLYAAEDLYPAASPVYGIVKDTELPPEWIPELMEYCNSRNVVFFASVFGKWSVDLLDDLNIDAYKLASSETVKLDLVKYIAAKKRPMLISTGMCDLADVHEALEVAASEGNDEVVLMQCTAIYPTEPEDVNLRVMDTLRDVFGYPTGLSDHTLDTTVPIAAVARGACVIEKHLTLGRDLPGPDHSYALEPGEFKKMVSAIRATERALGSPVKTMLREEGRFARRDSIRAMRDITSGETITPDMIGFSRPGEGIRPRFLAAVTGCKASRPIAQGEALTWECLSVR